MELFTGETPSVLGIMGRFIRKRLFNILSQGPIPSHIAFILDGNRRFARKNKLQEGDGYKAGFLSLLSSLTYCYELGVKYATVYAFSIDNFRRRPSEVQYVMDLMLEKIKMIMKEESTLNSYGVGVRFKGNIKLLSEPLQIAVEKVMKATAHNSRFLLYICVAYTSTDEIVHAAEESCKENLNSTDQQELEKANGTANSVIPAEKMKPFSDIKLVELERNFYITQDVDVLIRSSGEKRLSNFLLWQATHCILYSPTALWPEIGFWHIVRAVVDFQRYHSYFDKKKKQL